MHGHGRLLVCVGAAAALSAGAAADEVINWNNILLDTIRAEGGPPCPISRYSAMMHTAVYDAVNSITRTHEPYLAIFDAPADASQEAAVAAAAHAVLSHEFPGRAAIYDAALAASLAAIPDGPAEDAGVAVGVASATTCVANRAADGTQVDPPYGLGGHPGDWRPTFPDFTQPPFSPGWGSSMPWGITDPASLRPAGPAGFTSMSDLMQSREYARQVNEVKAIGRRDSIVRNQEQTRIAFFWANDVNGTYKPPGQQFSISQVVSAAHGLTLEQNARLFALVAIAMGDAGVVAWNAKYNTDIDLWRPIDAIREADTDGNPRTKPDPSWEPLNPFSPPFPAWISGHATFGAAAGAAMAGFFGSDHVTFTIDSEDPFYQAIGGGTRTFHSFSEAAWENAESRLYLGVHYRFDAVDGNRAGTAIGEYVAGNLLRPICSADFNDDGDVNAADFFDFLHSFLGGESAADFNDDGVVNVQDFLDFLQAFFGGCA
jgi:hypothetical protein